MSQVKTSYSYDAPMDCINFTSLDDEKDTQNINSWFEEKANLEKQNPNGHQRREEEPVVIRAVPVPHFKVSYKPQIPEITTVEICPSPLILETTSNQLQKDKKIKELQKGKVPKSKALRLPHFATINLPEKKVKNVTQMEPFFKTDKRGVLKAQTWKHQLEEDRKQQKAAACIKACPNTVTSQEPFVPKKEGKKSVAEGISGSLVQEPFQATEKRAKK
ncbi:Targeting protein for Xklp2 [Tupaia chinensis]|uniref:Targeting protein for Xklp2 n=1 Tax=Tupaia chinensis TaxID=246437 RepID=L9KH08_TUPCH|nr:Targeting protein for Xklp2 [Tupaia chinensis]